MRALAADGTGAARCCSSRTPRLRTGPASDRIRIEVHATSANLADILMIGGTYQTLPPFPLGPGLECSGSVRVVGDECRPVRVGDRVMSLLDHSGFAELATARESDKAVGPRGNGHGGGLGLPGRRPVVARRAELAGRPREGETVLILGAAGGVGLTAVETRQHAAPASSPAPAARNAWRSPPTAVRTSSLTTPLRTCGRGGST